MQTKHAHEATVSISSDLAQSWVDWEVRNLGKLPKIPREVVTLRDAGLLWLILGVLPTALLDVLPPPFSKAGTETQRRKGTYSKSHSL